MTADCRPAVPQIVAPLAAFAVGWVLGAVVMVAWACRSMLRQVGVR